MELTTEQKWRRDVGLVLAACIGGSIAWMCYLVYFAERLP